MSKDKPPKGAHLFAAEIGSVDLSLASVTGRLSGQRLLSTLPFNKIEIWRKSVDTIAARPNPLSFLTRLIGIPDITVMFRLLWRARRYDVVLLNGGERADLFYLALAGMLPWIRTPHLIVDAHWQVSNFWPARLLQRLVFRLGRRLIAEVQPHSPEEIEQYHRDFGIPEHLIRPLPWSTSLTGYDIVRRTPREDIVVTGGNSYRDYPTLLAAAARFTWPLEIGLPKGSPERRRVKSLVRRHGNSRLVSDWTYHQYWERIANAQVFAMAITPGLTRCTADQTMLNAMSLGAIVVATDSVSSRLYIRHGINGFLVPESSVDAWVDAVNAIRELPDGDRRRISQQAEHDATTLFGEEARLRRTLLRAASHIEQRRRALA